MSHPLLSILHDAADGRFPAPDGSVTYLPALDGGLAAIVSFTAHAVIASELTAADLAELEPDGYGRALIPEVQLRVARGRHVGVLDVTMVGRGRGGDVLPRTDEWDDHSRVSYAQRIRADVRVHGDERGLVTLSHGLAGRREIGVELIPALHGTGAGRAFLADVLTLVPEGEPVFAAVSPGNARSLRAFLAAGFVPIGSEVVIG